MRFLELIFGCFHKNTTFPQTPRGKRRQGCYIVCLECGKEQPYDWKNMRAVVNQKRVAPVLQRESREAK